jgi:hypothetical protein
MTLEFAVINKKGILRTSFHKDDVIYVGLQNTTAGQLISGSSQYIGVIVKSVTTLICKTFVKFTVVVSRSI